MENYWICPTCEALNSECTACGETTYNTTEIKTSKLFLEYPDALDSSQDLGDKIIIFFYTFLVFLSNFILKNYKFRLPLLIGFSIFSFSIMFIMMLS